MFKNIAGCVVLYNPTEAVLANLNTYETKVNKLYIIDNSESIADNLKKALVSRTSQTVYCPLKQNLGIAHALNMAATKALQDGFEWLLMMDQDSSASASMIDNLFSATESVAKEQIGIIAPSYIEDANPPSQALEEVTSVITSGSILNLEAYRHCGPFREDFFIDFVDHEYCLRLQQQGLKVLINHQVKLNHQLGNLTCHNFLGWKLCTSNHNYLRRYYITRNRMEILRQFKGQFPDFIKSEKNKNLVEVIKMLFFEKDKWRKIRSVFLGYLDYKRRRFGKYRY